MDVSLPKGEPIYLVLNTPGGDVEAGNQLIDTANGLSRPVHTITIFAASMGFNTVQALGNRYILPSGTLMAHRVRVGGIGGQVPGEFLTAVTRVIRQTQRMEMRNASRMGISFADYTKLINAEYWVDGEDAVRQGVADAVVNIRCDASLEGTSEETLQTPFGPISLIWSDCPAVTNPIGFKYSGPSPQDAVKSYLSNRQAKGIYGQ
jgi:ATP-dependent protease ClpP protease subunit